MQHFEAVYLLSMAHRIRQWERQAEDGGGTFHPAATFTPLKNGLSAQARIKDMDGQPVFAVIIRQPEYRSNEAEIVEVAKGLFLSPFRRIPELIRAKPGYIDHLFFSTDIPPDPLEKLGK